MSNYKYEPHLTYRKKKLTQQLYNANKNSSFLVKEEHKEYQRERYQLLKEQRERKKRFAFITKLIETQNRQDKAPNKPVERDFIENRAIIPNKNKKSLEKPKMEE